MIQILATLYLIGATVAPLAQVPKEGIEAKVRVCDGRPATVIVENGTPKYGIVDAGIGESDPICYDYERDPATITIQEDGASIASQGCHWAKPWERLSWRAGDIRPEDVSFDARGKALVQSRKVLYWKDHNTLEYRPMKVQRPCRR